MAFDHVGDKCTLVDIRQSDAVAQIAFAKRLVFHLQGIHGSNAYYLTIDVCLDQFAQNYLLISFLSS